MTAPRIIMVAGSNYSALARALDAHIRRHARAKDVSKLQSDALRHGYCLLDADGARLPPKAAGAADAAALRISYRLTVREH